MNGGFQTRPYTCPTCTVSYRHDLGYRHELFDCATRQRRTGTAGGGRSLSDHAQALLVRREHMGVCG